MKAKIAGYLRSLANWLHPLSEPPPRVTFETGMHGCELHRAWIDGHAFVREYPPRVSITCTSAPRKPARKRAPAKRTKGAK